MYKMYLCKSYDWLEISHSFSNFGCLYDRSKELLHIYITFFVHNFVLQSYSTKLIIVMTSFK